MSELGTTVPASLGDPAYESKVRASDVSETHLRVYGVDRTDGLTPNAKYTSKELSRYKVLRPGMFAYNPMRLNIGSIAACTEKHTVGLVSPDYVVFGCKPGALDPAFLGYVIEGPEWRQWTTAAGVGSVRVRIYFRELAKMPLTAPSLAEQKAIAAVLGALDDKIELNRRMNATLEAIARALFQSWFVDFDPVRAKLDNRQPIGLDEAIANLFPEHFEHGEHEMLPVEWRHAAIEEICAINAWTLGKSDDLATLEYIEISEVSRGNIANIVTYSRGEEPSRARRRLRHGDTVLSTVRPDRGSYFLAFNPPENRVASTGFVVLTPTKVPWSFVHAAMTQPEVSDHLGQMADGGAYPAVRPEVIGAIRIALPNNAAVLDAFHRICAPLFEKAEANRAQSRTLATLRDTLLPRLLSGELRVTYAEVIAAETV